MNRITILRLTVLGFLSVVGVAQPSVTQEWTGEITRTIEDHFEQGFSQSIVHLKTGDGDFRLRFTPGVVPPETTGCAMLTNVRGTKNGDEILATSLSSAAAIGSCSALGEQKVVVVLLSYPGQPLRPEYTQNSVRDLLLGSGMSLDGYLREASFGKTWVTGTVVGPFTTDKSFVCFPNLQELRDNAVRAANNSVDFTSFNKILLIVPHAPDCVGDNAGEAEPLCASFLLPNGTTGLAATALATTGTSRPYTEILPTIIHEIGHTLGLGHASGLGFSGVPLGPVSELGLHDEYGDRFATMGGYRCSPSQCTLGHFAAEHKVLLGWLDESRDVQRVESSGTYTLAPYETQGGIKALKIRRPGTASARWLWIEYRQPIGYDATLDALNSQVFSGALVRYDPSPGYEGSNYVHLLDFHPATSQDFADAFLLSGETWTDPYSSLSIKIGPSTPVGLPVTITLVDNSVYLDDARPVEGWGNGASFNSGSYLQLKGIRLASTTRSWSEPAFQGGIAPTKLDGVSVSIAGKPAFVSYVSPNQVNVQAPDDPVVGLVPITVTNASGVSNTFSVFKTAIAPGMLAPANFQVGGKQYLVATHGLQYLFVGNPNLVPGAPFQPAKPHDSIWLYGIGFGDATPSLPAGALATGQDQINASFSIRFGQVPANVTYAGHYPGYVGLYLFIVDVPDVVDGDQQIHLIVNGQELQQTVFLTVKR